MVLVGLGVDSRALRIVNYLAKSGIDISLLTFNAFKHDGALFLARQVESMAPIQKPGEVSTSQTKEGNLQALRTNAAQFGVVEFVQEVADFIEKQIPGYRWPGKTNYSFSLNEYTDQGKPTIRVYVNVALNLERPKSLTIVFQKLALDVIGENIETLTKMVQCWKEKSSKPDSSNDEPSALPDS